MSSRLLGSFLYFRTATKRCFTSSRSSLRYVSASQRSELYGKVLKELTQRLVRTHYFNRRDVGAPRGSSQHRGTATRGARCAGWMPSHKGSAILSGWAHQCSPRCLAEGISLRLLPPRSGGTRAGAGHRDAEISPAAAALDQRREGRRELQRRSHGRCPTRHGNPAEPDAITAPGKGGQPEPLLRVLYLPGHREGGA